MKKSVEILVHVFFWIAFTGLSFMLSKVYLRADPYAPFSDHLFYVTFLELVMGLIFFYATFFGIRWIQKPETNHNSKKAGKIILPAVLFILLIFFAIPAMRVGFLSVLSSVVPHIILIFLAIIFRRFSDSLRLENEKRELLYQNIKSELAVLKMQLSPHFLFNTLNNIDYLVSFEPAKASDSLSKLGTILRYMIYETEEEKIDLNRELIHIEDYIELLRLRSENRDFLRCSMCNVSAGQFLIAPMLFLPLIENSYKHCTDRNGDSIIDLSVTISENILSFSISNEYDGTENEVKTCNGIGLNNVRRRLDLMYPGKHKFEIEKKGTRFNVGLKLELDEYQMCRR